MKRISLKSFRLCFLILFAISVLSCRLATAQSGQPATVAPKPDLSVIMMVFNYNGQLSVVDPQGRLTGIDPVTGENRQDIPKSAYYDNSIGDPEGDAVMESMELDIREPAAGDYKIAVVGTQEENYEFGVRTYDIESNTFDADFDKVPIATGEAHHYLLSFDKMASSNTTLTGGFDGGGEQAHEIDSFLSYVNVVEHNTKLPVGTGAFDLFIIYGKTILPETFTATLNGLDVSDMFKPTSRGYQIVSIPLTDGENELELSVSSPDTQDTDNLMFIVE